MNALKLEGSRQSIKAFETGEVLFYEGDTPEKLYIIASGKVRLLKDVNGRQVTQLMKGEGDFIGEVSIFLDEPQQFTAVVEEDSQIAIVEVEDIKKVLSECPEWISNIMLTLGERVTALRELMRDHRMDDPSLEGVAELSSERDRELFELIKAHKSS